MNTSGHGSPPAPSVAQPATLPRVALVTGGAKRLGRHMALALARDGWDIGIHYGQSAAEAEQTVAEIQALGRRAVALQAALEQTEACRQLIPRLEAALGPVCGLVNSASRFVYDDIQSLSPQSLDEHLRPNLVAPMLLSQALAEQLARHPNVPDGVIVNLLDQKLGNLNPDFLSYTLTKAALAAATTMLAQALAPRIRVVGIAPGLTLPSYLQDEAAFEHAHRTLSPLGASSTADDIAASVVFAMKTRSITGSVLTVDGGQHLLGLPRDASLMTESGSCKTLPTGHEHISGTDLPPHQHVSCADSSPPKPLA